MLNSLTPSPLVVALRTYSPRMPACLSKSGRTSTLTWQTHTKAWTGPSYADWAQAFGGLFPDPRPTFLPDHGPVLFDQLVTPAVRNVDDEGKVSVVITSFRPGVELLTAVRSIVNQSWSNLEILLVDDGSPSEHGSILDQCVTLDARVKLIRLDANVGTYMARNVALDAATGDFVTFQDSDDWSHPKRIEEQVRLLLQDKTLMATVSEALKVTEHLSITKPGRNPRVMCTSSMMFRRRSALAKIGYMDSVRKSADTEYLRRIEVAFTPRSVHRIRDSIYALIRQHNGSLSACEFREGGCTQPASPTGRLTRSGMSRLLPAVPIRISLKIFGGGHFQLRLISGRLAPGLRQSLAMT